MMHLSFSKPRCIDNGVRRGRGILHDNIRSNTGGSMNSQKGFTLIELMIVVAIIAILAAIAISQYQDYVIRSQVSEGSSLNDGVKTAVAGFYDMNGSFPISNA